MKGVFEFTETFLKMLTAGYLAVMLLGIFFAVNNYYLYFTESEANRDVLVLADGILSANCLISYNGEPGDKAIFREELLYAELALSLSAYNQNNIRIGPTSCVIFGKNFKYDVIINTKDRKETFNLGDRLVEGGDTRSTLFPATMRTSEGDIIPVLLQVTVEV